MNKVTVQEVAGMLARDDKHVTLVDARSDTARTDSDVKAGGAIRHGRQL